MDIQSELISRKFWSLVSKSNKCWIWIGGLTSGGYGDFRYLGIRDRAHRTSWKLENKKEPKDCILHKCDNRKCVRPDHLFEGSRKDNAQDAVKKGRHSNLIKTKCSKGHEFKMENTYIHKNGSRRCKKCAADYYRKIKEAQKSIESVPEWSSILKAES